MRIKLHSKTPISMVLLILGNIILIVLLELLLFYRSPAKPDAKFLAAVDARYENCIVSSDINLSGDRGVKYYLVKTADGQTDLVPMRQHSFVPSRTRLYTGKIIQDLDTTENTTIRKFFGMNVCTISVYNGQATASFAGGSNTIQSALTKYMGLSVLLMLLESLVWYKLKGND